MPEPTTPEPALPEPTTPDPALPEPTTPEPALPDSTTPEPNGHAADAPLLTSVVDGVGHVVLNRPRALNCLTQSMVDALLATIAWSALGSVSHIFLENTSTSGASECSVWL